MRAFESTDSLMKCSYRFVSGHRLPFSGICPPHNHPCFEIVYHPSGHGTTLIENNHKVEFQEGSVVIYAPFIYHDEIMLEPGVDTVLHIEISGPVPDKLPQSWYIQKVLDPYLLQELRLLSEVHPSRTHIQQQIFDHRAASVMLTLFNLDAFYNMQINSPAEYYAERACQYLRQHYQTLKHIDEIANYLNISPSYLRYLYRLRFGTSIVKSLTSLRIERAQDLLENPAMTLSAIATDCGFANERYFSTVFKKNVGCTPGQFRKR